VFTKNERRANERRERETPPPALPAVAAHASLDAYVAAHPEASRFVPWLGRRCPTAEADSGCLLPFVRHALFFVALQDHDRWCTLPGGFFWATLCEDRRPGSAGWRVDIEDGDDWSAERTFSLTSEGEAEARGLVEQMMALAPFEHDALGAVFGLWPDGQAPGPRPKRRR